MNRPETINDQIDLIGQYEASAVNITQNKLIEIKRLLAERKIMPNHSKDDHVFKVIAHQGKHSRNGIATLKFAIEELLNEMKCDYYKDMHHGVFLVRIKV